MKQARIIKSVAVQAWEIHIKNCSQCTLWKKGWFCRAGELCHNEMIDQQIKKMKSSR